MNIAFVTPYYWPEDFGAGVQCAEIAEYLVAQGHEVTVFTQMPNYPKGIIFEEYSGKDDYQEIHNSVQIKRVKARTATREDSLANKALSAMDFGKKVQTLFGSETKFDVVLSISPPPFAGLAAAKLAKRNKCRLVVRVADIASLAVETAGAGKHPGAKVLRYLEIKMLKKADHLILAADYFQPFIDSFVGSTKPRTVVFDWADGEAIQPLPRQNEVSREWGLDDKFVVMYSGSIGYTSNLIPLLEAAKQLQDNDSIRFLILGEGVKKNELLDFAKEHQLSNVEFKPLQPREIFPQVLASSDLQVISLTEEGAKSSGQGKMKTILAAGKPILGIVPGGSNEHRLLQGNGLGFSNDGKSPSALSQLILDAQQDNEGLARMALGCRGYFESNYEAKQNLSKIARLLTSSEP